MYRVDKILNDPWYRECLARNAAREEGRRFCSHDLHHMLDVARIAYILALEEGNAGEAAAGEAPFRGEAGKEVIYGAGLLHDMARWHEYETGADHAATGARMAGPVLDRAGFYTAERNIITAAIAEHRTGGPQTGLLGRYLSRADDLSRPCSRCRARSECHKLSRMDTADHFLY